MNTAWKLLTIVISLHVILARSASLEERWGRFKARFGKVYRTGEEEEWRKSIFISELKYIEDHNELYRSLPLTLPTCNFATESLATTQQLGIYTKIGCCRLLIIFYGSKVSMGLMQYLHKLISVWYVQGQQDNLQDGHQPVLRSYIRRVSVSPKSQKCGRC